MSKKDKLHKVHSKISDIRKRLNDLNDDLEKLQEYIVDEMFKEE